MPDPILTAKLKKRDDAWRRILGAAKLGAAKLGAAKLGAAKLGAAKLKSAE